MTTTSPLPHRPLAHRLRTVGTVVAATLLAAALGVGAWYDTHERLGRIEGFMVGQAQSLAEIITHVATDATEHAARLEGLKHIATDLSASRSVCYVSITGTGFHAISPGKKDAVATLPPPSPEVWARPGVFSLRQVRSDRLAVLEACGSVLLPNGNSLRVRIGFDPEPYEQLAKDIRMRSTLRMIALLAGAVLVVVLLFGHQRQAGLNREIARITDRLERRREEARRTEKLVAMGALAAGVAHQLRNPLNSIHLLSQVLVDDADLPSSVTTRARHIHDEAQRLDASIGQFLEFARPRQPVAESFDLARVTREVAALQGAAHAAQGVEVVADAPGAMRVETDRGFVVECLENLLRNAIEAGASQVTASLSQAGDTAVVEIADNGAGVDDDDRERIFDLYFTRRPAGTGLGLSLVNQMVTNLGGAVHLARKPGLEGRGARFVVRLPRRRKPA